MRRGEVLALDWEDIVLVAGPARTAEERLGDPAASGVVSHASAAGLHDLGDLLDDRPEFTFPYRKQSIRHLRLHQGELPSSDVTPVDGLPVTTVERTIADCCATGRTPSTSPDRGPGCSPGHHRLNCPG